MRILQYIILSALCSFSWPVLEIHAAQPVENTYTAEAAEAIATRMQHEASDPQYIEALALYQARDFGEAQKRLLPLATSGNSMAALYVWRCNPNGRTETLIRNTAKKNIFYSFPVDVTPKKNKGKEPSRTWDPSRYLQMAAEWDNPYAMYILGRTNPAAGAGWVTRAQSYWQTRARAANDPDAWFCLGFYTYYCWPNDFVSPEMYLEGLEYIYKGAMSGSEAAVYVLANSRKTWLSQTFQEHHPDWETNLLIALEKLIEAKRPHAQYLYSQLKMDDQYLELAANQNLYDAWVHLVDYLQSGGKRRPRHKNDYGTYTFRDENLARKNAFYRNVLEIYERGRTLKYDDTPFNGIEYQYNSVASFVFGNDEDLRLSASEYESIVGQALLWSKQNHFVRFIHPLMEDF